MTARSLRVDLPYIQQNEAVHNVPVVVTAQTTLLTADAPTHETGETTLSLAALTAGHLPQDTKQLAQLLYETLVQLHTPAGVQNAIDNDTWNLLTRCGVMHGAVNSVEYYSNIGTFVCEAALTQQAGVGTLLDARFIQQLQIQGQLPGLEAGMTWRSGYIRLARLGERPVLLLPTNVESKPASREAPSDAEG